MSLRRPTAVLKWTCTQCRTLHRLNTPTPKVPQPTPFVPDPQTFLTLIGRKMSQHASKIPTWEALFTQTSEQLKNAGVEPARARRYLLWWRERYRNGIMGMGGDLHKVKDGVAELRVVEVPSDKKIDAPATLTKGAGMRKVVVNVEPTLVLPKDPVAAAEEEKAGGRVKVRSLEPPPVEIDVKTVKPVAGVKIVGAHSISGTGIEAVKGYQGVARLKVQDGLWEERRGHKVDGGERRKAEVRYKRAVAEKKAR